MDFKHLLLNYGPFIVLVVTFFEGETVLLAAGFLAHQGYISLEWSIVAAFFGSSLGDQLYFWIGRKFGTRILDWRPGWRTKIDRALRLLVRYQNLFILSFRFIYVVRNVASFSIGLAGVSYMRFAALNALAAAIWALSFGVGGFYFGKTLEIFLGRVQELEAYAIAFVFFAVAGFLVWRRMRKRRILRAEASALPEGSRND